MDDLAEHVGSRGPELKGCKRENAAEAVRQYLGGKSVYHAARAAGVSERRHRDLVRLLGLKRPEGGSHGHAARSRPRRGGLAAGKPA